MPLTGATLTESPMDMTVSATSAVEIMLLPRMKTLLKVDVTWLINRKFINLQLIPITTAAWWIGGIRRKAMAERAAKIPNLPGIWCTLTLPRWYPQPSLLTYPAQSTQVGINNSSTHNYYIYMNILLVLPNIRLSVDFCSHSLFSANSVQHFLWTKLWLTVEQMCLRCV